MPFFIYWASKEGIIANKPKALEADNGAIPFKSLTVAQENTHLLNYIYY